MVGWVWAPIVQTYDGLTDNFVVASSDHTGITIASMEVAREPIYTSLMELQEMRDIEVQSHMIITVII